jgi:hypothetical protein
MPLRLERSGVFIVWFIGFINVSCFIYYSCCLLLFFGLNQRKEAKELAERLMNAIERQKMTMNKVQG